MCDRYDTSTTTVTTDQLDQLIAKYQLKPWGKDSRYYLNMDALADLIGLDVTYYKTGSVKGCQYVDADGDKVNVAHSRAYAKGGYGFPGNKTFIKAGKVYCDWKPYGEDIAELVALAVSKSC